jgi:hypothetical protein
MLNCFSIVAIHGIGAHPDDTWCQNVGTAARAEWVNWLIKEDMLPAVAPNARIMRYGYHSQWYGEEAVRQNASTVAQRLMLALKFRRKVQTLVQAVESLLNGSMCSGLPTAAASFHSSLLRRAGRFEGGWCGWNWSSLVTNFHRHSWKREFMRVAALVCLHQLPVLYSLVHRFEGRRVCAQRRCLRQHGVYIRMMRCRRQFWIY